MNTDKQYNLIVDSREKNGKKKAKKILDMIAAEPSLKPLIRSMGDGEDAFGDYMVGDYLIERATIGDLIGKVRDGRLWNQLIKMKKAAEGTGVKPLLLIEGSNWNYYRRRYKFSENQKNGTFQSVMLDYQVPVIFTGSAKETVKFLVSNTTKDDVTSEFRVMRAKKGIGKKSPDEQAVFILKGFIDAGDKTAVELLTEGETLRNVLDMIINDGIYGHEPELFTSRVYKGKLKEKNDAVLKHVFEGKKK